MSSVVDDCERRLLDLVRQSVDLNDLESRIPNLRGQFLAQYGYSTVHDNSTSSNSQTMSSGSSPQTSNAMTPLDVAQNDQPRMFVSETHHSQFALPSASNDLTHGHDLSLLESLQPPLATSENLGWQQNDNYEAWMDDLFDWPIVHESSTASGHKHDISEPLIQYDDISGFESR